MISQSVRYAITVILAGSLLGASSLTVAVPDAVVEQPSLENTEPPSEVFTPAPQTEERTIETQKPAETSPKNGKTENGKAENGKTDNGKVEKKKGPVTGMLLGILAIISGNQGATR